ncbi:hypothetical protein ElyMa_005957700 [Elysia marginata]|uniref:SUEL-type lectin domain-containing protein n=1 Tax=Elysia marginata TaxID=1093978 RepID=A0AAV4GCA6_9GAST|nr:hypothetical protein ElyMa_005957700 [Elysia marginata]
MQDKVKIWSNSLPNPITATVFFASLAFLPTLNYAYGLSTPESGTMDIYCKNSSVIDIFSADYKPKTPDSTCTGKSVKTLVKDGCQDKEKCSLQVDNKYYSDPCPREAKMLYVTYACRGGE